MRDRILNEIKVFDDQKPPWTNAEIDNLITANGDFKKHFKKINEIAIILTNIKHCNGN